MLTVDDLKELLAEIKKSKKLKEIGETESLRSSPYELQSYLLQGTMKYVYENCNYYRHIFNRSKLSVADITNPNDLSKLPFTKKQELTTHTLDFMSKSVEPSIIGRTSGTTTGTPSIVYFSQNEIEANRVLEDIASHLTDREKKRRVGVVFSRSMIAHSAFIGTRGNMLVLPSAIDFQLIYAPVNPYVDLEMYHFTKLLQTKIHVSRNERLCPSVLYGSVNSIVPVTREMIKRKIDPSKTAIEYIGTFGHYYSKSTKKFVGGSWNASVYDTYSCAEHCGSAVTCENGDLHHFSISCIPEVVDINTGKPVPFGYEGILVMTSLYPFQQCIPLIRYWTGDVVTLTDEKCPNCGFEGISMKEFVGRLHRCLDLSEVAQGRQKFVSSAKVCEVLSQFEEFIPHQSPLPRFRLLKSSDGKMPKVKVEVEIFNAFVNENRLKDQLLDQILQRHSGDSAFQSIDFEIQFVPPFTIPLGPYGHTV